LVGHFILGARFIFKFPARGSEAVLSLVPLWNGNLFHCVYNLVNWETKSSLV